MKGKQLAILLLLVAVLGGAWYFLSERNRASWSAGGGGKVIEFPINNVAYVIIRSADGELNLVQTPEGWTVKERVNYPARFEELSDLLRKLWDLKTVQEVKAGPSQLPRLELVEPGKGDKAGTLVELKDKDGKTLNALLLGKKHLRKSEGGEMGLGGAGGFPSGRYVKTLGDAKISLVSEAFDNVEPKPEKWLLKDFLKIENPKSIVVAGATDAQRWSVVRENATAEWTLADAKADEKLDATKTSALASVFAAPTFNDVLAPDAKPEETGLDKPTVATIETVDGFRYELKIGKANGDNHPVLIAVSANFPKERTPGKDEKPEDKTKLDDEFKAKQKSLEEKLASEKKFEGRPYLIGKMTVEPLLRERAALLPDKPAETTAPPPATGAMPPVPGANAPITVTTPPVTVPAQPPKIEAVTPPVKIEAVTPPVQAPPLPPTPPAKEMPAEAPKQAPAAPPKDAPQPAPATPKDQPPAPAPPAAPAAPKEPPAQPAPEPAPAKEDPAPKP